MKKKQVVELMRKHMDNNGLQDWKIGFKNSKKILATCYYSKKEIRITKWYYELNDCKIIVKTILHEIGHAILGSGWGHGLEWKNTCRKIGLDNSTTYADTSNFKLPPLKFIGTCKCGKPSFRAESKRKCNGHCVFCHTKISWVETATQKPIDFNTSYRSVKLLHFNARRSGFRIVKTSIKH